MQPDEQPAGHTQAKREVGRPPHVGQDHPDAQVAAVGLDLESDLLGETLGLGFVGAGESGREIGRQLGAVRSNDAELAPELRYDHTGHGRFDAHPLAARGRGAGRVALDGRAHAPPGPGKAEALVAGGGWRRGEAPDDDAEDDEAADQE